MLRDRGPAGWRGKAGEEKGRERECRAGLLAQVMVSSFLRMGKATEGIDEGHARTSSRSRCALQYCAHTCRTTQNLSSGNFLLQQQVC